jgi:hypothetical protein
VIIKKMGIVEATKKVKEKEDMWLEWCGHS